VAPPGKIHMSRFFSSRSKTGVIFSIRRNLQEIVVKYSFKPSMERKNRNFSLLQ
jgi:hypothetical protein